MVNFQIEQERSRLGISYKLPPQSEQEEEEVKDHLLSGIDERSFNYNGTFKTSDRTELWSPGLWGFVRGYNIARLAGPSDLRRLSIHVRDPIIEGAVHPWTVGNIYPHSIRIVAEHHYCVRTNTLGYVGGGAIALPEFQLRLEQTTLKKESLGPDEPEAYLKISSRHYPDQIEILFLRPSTLQQDLADQRNFIVIGKWHNIIRFKLKYLPQEANDDDEVALISA